MKRDTARLNVSRDEMRLSELMRNTQKGDAASYRTLLLEIEKKLSLFVKNSFFRLGLGSSQAWEDVTQDILLAVHAKRATYQPDQYFLPWLYSIARYKIIDHARSARVQRRFIELELDLAELAIAQPEAENSSARDDLAALFHDLPEKQRQILELVKIQGLSIAEAAGRTGFSQADIKVTTHRALKTLQRKLRGENAQ